MRIVNGSAGLNFIAKVGNKIKYVSVTNKLSGNKNVKFRPALISSSFLEMTMQLLLITVQPAFKNSNDLYQFVSKCTKITLDITIVVHHNIVLRL